MSVSDHTPGPWEMRDGLLVGTDGSVVLSEDARARAGRNIPPNPPEVKAANARIIAAAPDMLEALRSVAEDIDHRR